MATFVIGDLQGCHEELERLLTLIRFDCARDRAVFVGDLVNRGPDSLSVLRRIAALAEQGAAESVLGNHDFFLILAYYGLAKLAPDDTLGELLAAEDAPRLIDWLRHRPLLVETGQTVIIHAGLLPSWSLAQARALAREVETALRVPDPRAFLSTLFGNEPRAWRETLAGSDRARVIVNAFARLRFCSAADEIEFREKRDARHAPAGFAPWFAHPERASRHARIVAGHWSSEGLRLWPNVTLIDSGCLWGGALTALRLDDGALFQVPSLRPRSLALD
ncbi:MAG: symmetrical bis(5'-nucleosyl)-tetraphosphatase [Casimicrobiaceae bacterium]|nr:symmetrical bis(5'-nucleosyl)-tetraphosphatase [Casimicrobiaceae bacterium]MCX8099401.1 symmetrical bis(5'-nucleosyl)-tetraphosphatase [Casimicrobiaceae bacterium]